MYMLLLPRPPYGVPAEVYVVVFAAVLIKM